MSTRLLKGFLSSVFWRQLHHMGRQHEKDFKKRGQKSKNHYLGQNCHISSDDSAHHNEDREKSGHSRGDRCQHRGQHLAASLKGCLSQRELPFSKMAVNIFKNHDGIIHNYSKNKDQAEEGHPVDWKAKTLHKDEGEEKGYRNADGSKQGVA